MKKIKNPIKYIVFGIVVFVLAMCAVVAVVPTQAKAFDFGQLIDPLCLFACDDDTNPIQQIVDPLCLFACDDESGHHSNPTTQVPNPTVSISANPLSVSYNGSSAIYWNSNNATSCTANGGANGWAGTKNTSGTFYTGSLTNSTTFNITCSNSTGSANGSVIINVENQVQNPTISISANPSSVSYNGSSTITWNSSNATLCNASGGTNGWAGTKNTSGTFYTGNLTTAVTYYITCSNNTGSANGSVMVFVGNQVQTCQDTSAINYGGSLPCHYYQQICQDTSAINYGGTLPCRYQNFDPAPTVSLRADDTSIDFEDSTQIRWDSDNATYCNASGGTNGWAGTKNTSGTFYTGSLTSDRTYKITCYNNNNNNSANDSITIRINDDNDNYNYNYNRPEVTTRSATNISAGNATLNGQVYGNGSSTRAWFEYGTNNNLTYSTSKTSYGSGSTNYNKNISGLISNTTYYFRAVAENSGGTVYGSIFYFNTENTFVNVVNNQPTVVISADSTNLAYNSATNIRWFTTNASSCFASGGSLGWAGVKNIGPGSFYTGQLTTSRTYTITCTNGVGTSTDSATVNVRGQVVTTPKISPPKPTPTSLVLITSSVDRNQPIVPTLDNTRPHPGDEINYTVTYQNIGTGAITGLTLRIDLPSEVNYLFSTPNNPVKSGNTLIFNLGTLKANGQGAVTAKVRVQNNVSAGINLNFLAVLSYIDPSNFPQSVNANVFAQVWSEPTVPDQSINTNENTSLGANVFGAGFLPTNLFGWLLLIILIFLLILIGKYLLNPEQSFSSRAITQDHPVGKKTSTTE